MGAFDSRGNARLRRAVVAVCDRRLRNAALTERRHSTRYRFPRSHFWLDWLRARA